MFYIRDNYKAKSHSGKKIKYCCRLLVVSITERMIKTENPDFKPYLKLEKLEWN